MAVIKLTGFTGEAPRVTPRLLPPSAAQIAQSVRLEDGELAPFRKPFPVADLAGATAGAVKTLYRHGTDWLWWSTVVNAVPGPVAADRLYYTGDGKPKMRVGSAVYDLAVPRPTGALAGTRTGTLDPNTQATRLYVYTFVTDFGEESEPCPVSNEVLASPGNTVTLSGFAAAPAGRAISKQRIYRSQTGTSGGTNLYFLAERAASTANYVDTSSVQDFSEALPSLNWNPPPDDLAGLTGMPNGMMVAFKGKDLYFCEPFRPHAWPESYVLTMDYDIVGLGVYDTTVVVATKGYLYFVGGTAPETMVQQKSELNMPCLNPQGMVDLGYAVAYPSHDGLVVVQGGSANVMTANLFTRDQWLKMEPDAMVCGQFYGRFFGAYAYTDTDGAEQKGMIILDLTGSQPFIIRSQHQPDAMFYEVTSGSLFMVLGTTVYEWDSKNAIADIYTWRSKRFTLPAPTTFGVIKCDLDGREDVDALAAYETAKEDAAAANASLFAAASLLGELNAAPLNTYALDGDILEPVPPGPQVAVNVYADGELLASIAATGEMQRIKGGRLARDWEVEITGNVAVQEVTMAGTAQELRSV